MYKEFNQNELGGFNKDGFKFLMVQGGNIELLLKYHTSVEPDPYYFGQVFKGFHYYSPQDFTDGDSIFILAMYRSEVIGVLKVKRYAIHNNRFVKENEIIRNYIAIRYIDVRQDFKNNGIGTTLIKLLAYYLKYKDSTNVIKVSPLSEEGQQFKVSDKIKASLPLDYKVKVTKR